MATYIVLINFTDQGIRNVKDTTKRADAAREMAKAAGTTIKEIYWTLGRYDLIATIEAPDEAAVTAMGLTLGKMGNLRTETMRAFSQSEISRILELVK